METVSAAAGSFVSKNASIGYAASLMPSGPDLYWIDDYMSKERAGEMDKTFRCYWQVRMCATILLLCPVVASFSLNFGQKGHYASERRTGLEGKQKRKKKKKAGRNHYRMETFADYICVSLFSVAIFGVLLIVTRRLSDGILGVRWTWPSPLGLSMGILSVFVAQILLLLFHYSRHRYGFFDADKNIIQNEKPALDFGREVIAHATRWEGLALLLPYLCLTWMLRLMPNSYYDLSDEGMCVSFFGLFDPTIVFLQLFSVDFFMYLAHITEHRLSWLYRSGHKLHHKWKNPRLFDAYSGHVCDTILMILAPLYVTANLIPSDCRGYIGFGTVYSAYLMLIHAEYALPFDAWLRKMGIGTAHDHNVHHSMVVYNFGHFFMIWDQLLGTYIDAATVKKNRIYEKPLESPSSSRPSKGGGAFVVSAAKL
eukprot:g1287.t1